MFTTRPTYARVTFLLVLLALLARPSAQSLAAGDIDQTAIDRAHDFLKTDERGKFVLGYAHFGASYRDHSFKEIRRVTKQGKTVAEEFALVYTFEWEADGETEIAFLCNRKGIVYDSQVVETNAIVQQPYFLANATIKVLGNLLLEAFKEQLKEADKKTIQTLVDKADAEGLMEFGLKLQQALKQ